MIKTKKKGSNNLANVVGRNACCLGLGGENKGVQMNLGKQ
jgi:hypothetical protein